MDNRTREKLHQEIQDIFPELSILYQPSTKITLSYPCIVYKTVSYPHLSSNNTRYTSGAVYELTIMSPLPGLRNVSDILKLPGCMSLNSYVSNDICMDVFRITRV